MPSADGKFRGMSVPAEAWDRIFGNNHPIGTAHSDAMDRRTALRASYEEHLDIIGPDDHSPFIRDFRRRGY